MLAQRLAVLLLALAPTAVARDVGVTLTEDELVFFDTTTLSPIATVLPPQQTPFNWALHDAVVTADGTRAYVSRQNGEILIYDLTLDPPALAAGTSSIAVQTNAADIALSPDERFLAVTGWDTILGNLYPISIVDLQTLTVADKIQIPGLQLHWGAAFGADGSVLYGTSSGVRRLAIDASGTITSVPGVFGPDPGGYLSPPRNVEVAPSGTFGVATHDGFAYSALVTFSIPGMQELSRARLDEPFTSWAGFSADGTHLFAASAAGNEPRGTLYAFAVDPSTGIIGPRRWTEHGVSWGGTFGIDNVALDATGLRLFGEYDDRLLIRDARDGALLGQLPLPAGTYVSTAVAR